MKNYISVLIMAVCCSLLSCKKKYTCNCSTSYTYKSSFGGYFTLVIPGSKTPYSKKLTKGKAKSACMHEQQSIQSNFTNAVTVSGAYSLENGESVITSCNIIF